MMQYFLIAPLLFDCLSPNVHYFKFNPIVSNFEIDNSNNYTIFKPNNKTIKLELNAKIHKANRPAKHSQPDVYFWIESKCNNNWNLIEGTKEYFDIYIYGVTNVYYSVMFNATEDFRIANKADNLIYNAGICFFIVILIILEVECLFLFELWALFSFEFLYVLTERISLLCFNLLSPFLTERLSPLILQISEISTSFSLEIFTLKNQCFF